MTLAFAILAHDDPKMLGRLVRRLSSHRIVVHVDSKTDIEAFEDQAKLGRVDYAEYAQNRINVSWGGYSGVEAMLSTGLEAAEGLSPNAHVAYLSGHCYPVRPVSEFAEYVAHSDWTQHARAYTLQSAGGWHISRYERRHWFDFHHFGMKERMPPPLLRVARKALAISGMSMPRVRTNLQVVAGSQWMALSVECLLEANEALASPQYRIFKNSFAPDEMAIQTYIHNSHWRLATKNHGVENATVSKVSTIPNFHLLDSEMTGHLANFDPSMRQATGVFFARKFSSSDFPTLDAIDARLDKHAEIDD